MKIPIEVSARHIHLSSNDKEILFGANYQFVQRNQLSQPEQYAAKETLNIQTSKGLIKNVRVVGPERAQTQLEISRTDAYFLGLDVKVKVSGDLGTSSGGVTLIGPKAKLSLKKGVIIAQRHLHIEKTLAQKMKLKHGQLVSVKTRGLRSVTFHNVYVRSRAGQDKLSFQIDTDEANAAFIQSSEQAELLR